MALLLLLILAVAPLGAQEPGPEQQVSPFGPDGTLPAVAMDSAGEFVVVWIESNEQVRVRRYSAQGAALGPAETVSGDTIVNGSRPAIASDSDGAFVVAWEAAGDGEFTAEIYTRRFDSAGAALSEPLRANIEVANAQRNPSVAMEADGDFIVAWEDESFSTSGDSDAIEFRRFTAAGVALDAVDRTVAAGDVGAPDVAVATDGSFALVWEQDGDIYGALYRAALGQLAPLRGNTPLNDQTEGFQLQPGVTMDADGSFVAVWNDSELGDVVAQPFRADGQLDGEQFAVSAAFFQEARDTDAPRAAYFGGSPVFAWANEGDSDTKEDNQVLLRRYGAGGPIDPLEQQVALLNRSNGQYADIAAGATGSFVVVWEARYDSCSDGCFGPGIFARLYIARNSYSLSTSTAGTNEGAGVPVTFTVGRSATAGGGRVGYSFGGTAVFGEDYRIARAPTGALTETGTIGFDQGVSAQRIELTIIDDARGEPTKSIVLRLRALGPGDQLVFPVAVVTLGDNDLAEVQIAQTGASTVVRQGEAPDRLSVALRTVPAARVVVTLTPTDARLNLGMGYGQPLSLSFEPDESAKAQRWVEVSTLPLADGAGLAANAGISLAARSADEGYDRGARFTVDGRDLTSIPVELVLRPGENPNPILPRVFLPALAVARG